MADDSYKTIKQVAEGYYTEKRSRFISYAIPVRTVEEVKEQLEKYRKQYYAQILKYDLTDARSKTSA